ncbi:membrane metallo-endopeptidase-like 1 [Nephila pilipes]|uniref:Membrane metallo-endopeptidase-like 1 n=2 Tax=Nephila pilipes TaxID=299642 RepID=A0A8X6N1C7_NEPPI|nr:membrane metallo-endopeptidase-like 1 [Nephila pilipes]GFT67985.1 membrane metallo-endopeptidase-like 1 [Nephila pilipes]
MKAESKKYHSLAAAVSRKSCDHEECVLAAAKIIQLMDRSVDPCDDFFDFSCGGFHHRYPLPDGRSVFSSFDVYEEQLDLDIKSILEEPHHINDSESLLKTKQVYQSCMNLENKEDSSERHLRDVLSNMGIGEWPLLDPDWKECRLDLEWRMAKLNAIGRSSLVRLETGFVKNAEYRLHAIMRIAHPLIFVDDCDDENTNASLILEKVEEHKKVLQTVLELLDVNVTDDVQKDMDDLFLFDHDFCNATKKCQAKEKQNIPDKESDKITLLMLADAAPQINWIRWRNIVFSELRLNFPHDKQDIYVYNIEECIEDLDNLLRSTPAKVLSNYLTWKFVLTHLGFLGTPFRQILENHPTISNEIAERFDVVPKYSVPLWKQCVTYVKKHMDMSILQVYHDHLEEDGMNEEAMDKIASSIKNEFRIIMKDTRSLLENDRVKSVHKIDRIQVVLAYPSKDDNFFATFYSSMGPINESFLKNGMALNSLHLRKLMEGVSTSKSFQDMEYVIQEGISAFEVAALISFDSDFVIVTLPMLKSFGLTNTLPKYKSMATMGNFLGHELSHAFDFEALDSSLKLNWTTFPNYVLRQAQRKARCFMNVPTNGSTVMMLSAQPTIIEDLSDHQGIHLAFKAYLRYLNEEGDEEILPGLPFSNMELFFINFAQQFCEIRSTEENFDVYSPGRRRVNEVLKNYPAFSETFRCPNGKPMNAHKCDILWQ